MNQGDTIQDSFNIETSGICGLWEVIRIYQDDEKTVAYPWTKDSFKFNFLPEKIFLCVKDGKNCHGTWELEARSDDSQKKYSIILEGATEFTILNLVRDEMTLSRQGNNYILVRRL